jgi:hypothetical protein
MMTEMRARADERPDAHRASLFNLGAWAPGERVGKFMLGQKFANFLTGHKSPAERDVFPRISFL